MRQLKWLCINGLFAIVIYFGLFRDIEGARNVAMFWAWLAIIGAFCMLDDEVMKAMRKKGRAFPASVNVAFDIVITSALVWSGAWVTGIFYFVHLVITEFSWERAR